VELETQFPEFVQRHGSGRFLSGGDLFLQLDFGFLVVPEHQNPSGEGRCSQQAHNESANGSSRVQDSDSSSLKKLSIFRADSPRTSAVIGSC